MAKQIKKEDKILKEIRTILEKNKAVLGTERTMKKLKSGEIKKIFTASNCPENIKKDLQHYSKISEVEIIETDYTNEMLGEICKKPFFISLIGVKSNSK